MRDLFHSEETIALVVEALGGAQEVEGSRLVALLTSVGVPPVEALRIRRTVLAVCANALAGLGSRFQT